LTTREFRAFAAQPGRRVGRVEHLAVPVALGDRRVGGVALQREVPDGAQQAALGLEREVDGLEGDVGLRGDGLHGRAGVAVRDEELPGGLEDRLAGGRRLLLAAGRVVRPLRRGEIALDRSGHFATLASYSLLEACS